MRFHQFTVFAALVATLSIAGCGSGGNSSVRSATAPASGAGTESTGEVQTLEQARARWAARNVRSYAYTVRLVAFNPAAGQPVRVEVQNGVPVSVTPLVENFPADVQTYQQYATVERLFAIIEDGEQRNADTIQVTYDSTYGFPKDVFIDYEQQLADEEFGIAVSDFEVR